MPVNIWPYNIYKHYDDDDDDDDDEEEEDEDEETVYRYQHW